MADGRYDNLVGSIVLGKKIPAVGVSHGIERVSLLSCSSTSKLNLASRIAGGTCNRVGGSAVGRQARERTVEHRDKDTIQAHTYGAGPYKVRDRVRHPVDAVGWRVRDEGRDGEAEGHQSSPGREGSEEGFFSGAEEDI